MGIFSEGRKNLFDFATLNSLYVAAKAHIRRRVKSKEVTNLNFRSELLVAANRICLMVVRNEMHRLEHLLTYYRKIGIEHFIIIDNESSDGTIETLSQMDDVSLFSAKGSYKNSRFGIDWINFIASKYCAGKWILHVDADEYLVSSKINSSGIAGIIDGLSSAGRKSLQSLMIDMYSERLTSENVVTRGQDPAVVCGYFDSKPYIVRYERSTNTNWIKGGVRGRMFFSEIERGPALNKTPLVLWKKHYAFLKSSHQLWPYHLNGSGELGQSAPEAALLHFKFLSDFNFKVQEEFERKQHTTEYKSYIKDTDRDSEETFFSSEISVKYEGWRDISRVKISKMN